MGLVLAFWMSCRTAGDSVVVVRVEAAEGLPGIRQLRATFLNAGLKDARFFPAMAGVADIGFATDFSVTFPRTRGGELQIALDGIAAGVTDPVAHGTATVTIKPGDVARVTINLLAGRATCGDGVLEPTEECDPAELGATTVCDLFCHVRSAVDAGIDAPAEDAGAGRGGGGTAGGTGGFGGASGGLGGSAAGAGGVASSGGHTGDGGKDGGGASGGGGRASGGSGGMANGGAGGPACKAAGQMCGSITECCGACVSSQCTACQTEGQDCTTTACCRGLTCFNGRCGSCKPASASCSLLSECCSGNCNPQGMCYGCQNLRNPCGSGAGSACCPLFGTTVECRGNPGGMSSMCCVPGGASCLTDNECCSSYCKSGVCCARLQQTCVRDTDCCDGVPCNGVCCRPTGATCATGTECCTQNCSPGGTCCLSPAAPCASGADCCSGMCNGRCCLPKGASCIPGSETCCGGACSSGGVCTM